MKNLFTQNDIELIENKIKDFESNTGCDLLIVVRKESDDYSGQAWMFSVFGSFILTFVLIIISSYLELHLELKALYFWPFISLTLTLILFKLSNFMLIKSLLINDLDCEKKCLEKAIHSFYTLGVTQVTHKVTALIMLSVLEKKIVLLVDSKLKEKIDQNELNDLINQMKKNFKVRKFSQGLIETIEKLKSKILHDFGGKVTNLSNNELSDKIHFFID